jgi:hypothetical protein
MVLISELSAGRKNREARMKRIPLKPDFDANR